MECHSKLALILTLVLLTCLAFSEVPIRFAQVQANPSKSLSIATNKHTYASQETVTVALTNTGTETVELRYDPWFAIFDSTGNFVAPLAHPEIIYINPGQTLTDTWDQRNAFDGQYVPSGSYTALSDSELTVESWTEFIIQDVRNPAPSRNGYRYPDQGTPGEPWVEWWYFKLTAPNGRSFFFCYYFVNPWDTGSPPSLENTGAYVFAGMSYHTEDSKVKAWDKYDVADFSAKEELCNVTIHDQANSALTVAGGQEYGDSIRIRGSLRPSSTVVSGKILGAPVSNILQYAWDLTFTQVLGLDTSNHPIEPNLFGWLIYMMEAKMSVGGTITIITPQSSQAFQIESADVQQWKGYQDHNWGKSFPERWIWGQCVKHQSFSLVLGGSETPGGTVDLGRLGLNLTHNYIDTDFLFFSWVSGDYVSFVFSNYVSFTDEGGTWLVPTSYVFETHNTGPYPQYKVIVSASWTANQIERLPLPRQVGNSIFNDFEPLGVSITVNIYKRNDQAAPWTQIDEGDLTTTYGGAEYGKRQAVVGGIVTPVDKFGLLAPYVGLASTIVVATVAAAIYVKRVKRRKEKQ